MKKLVTFAAAAVMCVPAFATDRQAPAAEPKIENPDSTGIKFTDVKINRTGSVKDQNKSGTCWAFSGLSTLEDNVMRKGGPELDISEMYLVRNAYIDKAKKFMRMNGQINFAQGGSWADVLDMTINQAVEFFAGIPNIINKIKVLQDIGLGYIKLGQPSSTLSGGENQRVKLATELSRRDTGNTLFILDEPTTGLHFDDIRVLLNVLNRLVDKGNTVLVIEHNLDVICAADYVIDMGPDGGRNGGHIVATGTPAQIAKTDSPTSSFIREALEEHAKSLNSDK